MSVSDCDLEEAIRIVAKVIEQHGELYWPIFDRLEVELQERRTRSARLRRYAQAERPGEWSHPTAQANRAFGSLAAE